MSQSRRIFLGWIVAIATLLSFAAGSIMPAEAEPTPPADAPQAVTEAPVEQDAATPAPGLSSPTDLDKATPVATPDATVSAATTPEPPAAPQPVPDNPTTAPQVAPSTPGGDTPMPDADSHSDTPGPSGDTSDDSSPGPQSPSGDEPVDPTTGDEGGATIIDQEDRPVTPGWDVLPIPPTPTVEEWYNGLHYLRHDCVRRKGLDNPDTVATVLRDRDAFSQAFTCFDRFNFNPYDYPSWGTGGQGEGYHVPDHPTPPLAPDVPVKPEQPTRPATPTTIVAHPVRPAAAPSSHPTPRVQPTPVPMHGDDGNYVQAWQPVEEASVTPMDVGQTLDYVTSQSFVDAADFTDGYLLPPAGPDQAQLSAVLEDLGLTSTEVPWGGTGTATAIDGNSEGTGGGKKVTYQIQMEGGMPVDDAVFASHFQEIIDKDTRYRFQRRYQGETDIVFVVGSPLMTQQLCEPDKTPVVNPAMATKEPDSCITDHDKVVINLRQWAFGPQGTMDGIYDSGNISTQQQKINEKWREKTLYDGVTQTLD